jgi:hypothetical protein
MLKFVDQPAKFLPIKKVHMTYANGSSVLTHPIKYTFPVQLFFANITAAHCEPMIILETTVFSLQKSQGSCDTTEQI